ncbi:MAG TPA: Holliday junction resolvase RuvX [Anaerolineales bacterium]|jgi:putative Holliday junction resolvase|nr:Holliday junction resolvase RuvX [Anaerolineales bacterium]|tara:strand:+ start:94 stop:522 length:429 start_codon:yes stop_codon:yes gene_type:complete
MRILAVDHGEIHLGLALSDQEGIVARPLPEHAHVSRWSDAAFVANTAKQEGVAAIVVGTPTDAAGDLGKAARRVRRFTAALKQCTTLPVQYWDESDSTTRATQISSHQSRRRNHSIHSIAAAVILQDYLDAHASQNDSPPES